MLFRYFKSKLLKREFIINIHIDLYFFLYFLPYIDFLFLNLLQFLKSILKLLDNGLSTLTLDLAFIILLIYFILKVLYFLVI